MAVLADVFNVYAKLTADKFLNRFYSGNVGFEGFTQGPEETKMGY